MGCHKKFWAPKGAQKFIRKILIYFNRVLLLMLDLYYGLNQLDVLPLVPLRDLHTSRFRMGRLPLIFPLHRHMMPFPVHCLLGWRGEPLLLLQQLLM